MEIFVNTFERLEDLQVELAKIYELDNDGVNFQTKKEVTSAMRRIAPDGLATTIGWTSNFRTLRSTLEMRTHPSAEEEMRIVFGKVGHLMMERYPNIFADYTVEMVKDHPWFKTENTKI